MTVDIETLPCGELGFGKIPTEEYEQNKLSETLLTASEAREFRHPRRRLESAAVRNVLQQMLQRNNVNYRGLIKDQYGRPSLKGTSFEISVSHSGDLAAAVIHPSERLGIDVERISDKISRVLPRFLHENEAAQVKDDDVLKCFFWCAKEAAYKWHGTRKLDFRRDIRLDFENPDAPEALIFPTKKRLKLFLRRSGDYCCVVCAE